MPPPNSESPDPLTRLDGWESIAYHLQVSVKTAHNWEKETGLPVHRFSDRDKSRVWVTVGELDSWLVGRPKISPVQPIQELHPVASEMVPPPRLQKMRLWMLGGTIVFASLIGWIILNSTPLADFKVHAKTLFANDETGKELWRHTFPWSLSDSAYGDEYVRRPLGWIGDLKGNGHTDFLFVAIPVELPNLGSTLFCFRGDRDAVRWSFKTERVVVDRGGDRMVPPYYPSGVAVVPGPRHELTRVIVSSHHYLSQPTQVAVLDTNGNLVGEYWHPGHLYHMDQADLLGNGERDLLLTGVNNGNHQATLVILDPRSISGPVTPAEMRDQRFALLNMPAAKEKAVVLFPRSCLSAGQPFTVARAIRVTKDRILVVVAENIEPDGPGFVYEFDYNLNVVNVVASHAGAARRFHQDLQDKGLLNHPFDADKEYAELKAGVIVRRP